MRSARVESVTSLPLLDTGLSCPWGIVFPMPTPLPHPLLTAAQRHAWQTVHARREAMHAPPVADTPPWPIHVHFHPDWRVGGRMVMEHLATQGRYRSQFETGISNGSYSPTVGGQRWQWEHDWFGGAYDQAPVSERPTYGAPDVARRPTGAAPRFGSAHLRLKHEVALRSTFCDPDSFWQPTHWGSHAQMDWAQLQCMTLDDPLDRYVEAHIHGDLLLPRDVAAVVLDPSHADTEVAFRAVRCGVAVEYHSGFRADAAALCASAGYRGADIQTAALRLLQDAQAPALTPALLGRAHAENMWEPAVLKKVWHCVAGLGDSSFPR